MASIAIFLAAGAQAQPATRRSVISFEVLRTNRVDEATAHTWLLPVVRESQECLGPQVQTSELGRLHVGSNASNGFTVALSPIGPAAVPGSGEQALFACVYQTFSRIAQQAAPSDGDVTLRVHLRAPRLASGLLKLAMGPARVLAHPLLVQRIVAAPTAAATVHEGTLARETLQAQMASHEAEVRDCFQAHLRTDRQSPASFELEFEIHENGHVLSAQVLNDEHVSPVTACVIDRLRSWQLGPPHGGPVRVRHSFTADLRHAHP